MFVELAEQLRCPAAHEESWLVLAAGETQDRRVIQGMLGCPVCAARYPITGGVADFSGNLAAAHATPDATAGDDDPEWPMRLAAFLDLGEGRGFVGLFGEFARHAAALDTMVDAELVAIDPPGPIATGISAVIPPHRGSVPIASGALRGVAVDRTADAATILEASRLVRPGGRILAPATVAVPPDVTEIARDAGWWVGERGAAPSGLVPLGSRRR